jgi:hypothetical protein
MRTSDSAAEVVAAVRPWAEMTAQTTSSYGGCDPVHCAWDSSAYLPSVCLPLPNLHADLDQRVQTKEHPCLYGLCLIVTEALLDGTPAGQPVQASHPLTAPGHHPGGGMQTAQDLCPWSFYQRHSWTWTPQGWGGHVQYLEGCPGQQED